MEGKAPQCSHYPPPALRNVKILVKNYLPSAFKVTVALVFPKGFSAWHVNSPESLTPTERMFNVNFPSYP